MPFALLIVGTVLIISGVRNTNSDLTTLLKNDFTGKNSFMYWMVSIIIIGALGYSDTLKPISRMFLVLVIVVLFLSNGGVFNKFNQQIFSSTGN